MLRGFGGCWWPGSGWVEGERGLGLGEPGCAPATRVWRAFFQAVSLACLGTDRGVFLFVFLHQFIRYRMSVQLDISDSDRS